MNLDPGKDGYGGKDFGFMMAVSATPLVKVMGASKNVLFQIGGPGGGIEAKANLYYVSKAEIIVFNQLAGLSRALSRALSIYVYACLNNSSFFGNITPKILHTSFSLYRSGGAPQPQEPESSRLESPPRSISRS